MTVGASSAHRIFVTLACGDHFRLEVSDARLIPRQVVHAWMVQVLPLVIDLIMLRVEVVDEI